MTGFLDLFSGIGGFALGAYWAGLRFDKHYFSEIDDYAVQVYQRHFPNAEPLGDIRNVDYSKLPRGEYLVTGGFPCQPHSVAGKRKGSGDERDLWPECARVLRELRPSIALFENVRGLFTSPGRERKGEFFNGILLDIFKSGYDAEWQIISAQDAGAPHKRERVWIVAYSDDSASTRLGKHSGKIYARPETERFSMGSTNVAYTKSERRRTRRAEPEGQQGELCPAGCCCSLANASDKRNVRRDGEPGAVEEIGEGHRGSAADGGWQWWAVEPDVGRVAHGIPSRVDRLKGLGNAVVPQCVEMILSLPAFDRWRAA